MNNYKLFVFIAVFCGCLTGCNPQSKDLDVKLIQDYLCIFTNNPKTHYGYDNSIVVSAGKIDHTRQFKSNYEQLYKNGVLPINEKSCAQIPIDIFEKNVVYGITLETNKIYHRKICLLKSNGRIVIKYINSSKNNCE
ncbi:NF045616 family extracytoplasmic (lipo)protein [Acinetobacter sp. 1000160]|uniref:NF045616 family extracytoplasmic (lipo)protein n=1 Tax=Acinetobacter sp. 1000160 TaxID=1310800 RepID=UPI000517F200|nr:NF045616 family extracytoplasmic (lipo)protein [Acinetobacter sp. 1000160]